ncbi:uncharacterized protein BO66DRAFT_462032 [Aspergillus aculeatinus CBS 121060]|uniref:Uncharacterized protein n=1 Tax=Aspergillus aculeatinus CBS 121060 TaxID=1448322 RepID=A0ACD1GW51_9EURO|nr:hypothetical protein BO66DRAFT_462032 [Aspergillus aculeatinus CBS 121060]RAH65558.1 hypothetical protein BO66DRAFT_462032 [Aspergillus aculeatinus CBS 121060]
MRVSVSAQAVVFSLAFPFLTTAADDASYNASLPFRPNNVTLLHDPYYWVGSYYNGTTELKLMPYTGLAGNDSAQCPLLANTTTTARYDTILALTEPSIRNNGSDPVNAFLMLWDPGFDFSTITSFGWPLVDLPFLQWSYLSSQFVALPIPERLRHSPLPLQIQSQNWFYWELNTTTQSPPYRLSSTITTYYNGAGALRANMTNCTSTEIVPWLIDLGPWAPDNNFAYESEWPAMTVSMEFDGETANYTIRGYFDSYRIYSNGTSRSGGEITHGQFTLRFAGVLDAYHSDILANDTVTPTWLRTVGFNNNSLNIGYTGAAGRTMSAGSSVAAAFAALVLTQVVQLFL